MSRGWKVWVAGSGKDWRCRWSGKYGTGQHVFLYKDDARDLRDKKKLAFQRYDAGLPVAAASAAPRTVGQVADEYLAYSKREKAQSTYRNFDAPAIASLRVFLGNDRLLADVQPAEIQRWKHQLGPGTALMRYRQAVAYLNYAVRLRYLAESPAKGLRRPAESGEGRALNDGELLLLLKDAPEPLLRTAVFSVNTMLRIGEVCAFDWAWVSKLPTGAWLGRIPQMS